MMAAITFAAITWYLSQIERARRRSVGASALLTGGQVIVLMQLMAALQNLDFQWTGKVVEPLRNLILSEITFLIYLDFEGRYTVKACKSCSVSFS